MQQATLELDASRAPSTDRTGFQIGWDHAHHGLVPPAELLLQGTPLGQGWRAGKAVFGRRTLATQRATRQWLALRTRAWCEGIDFDPQHVTAQLLSKIEATRCPVLRTPLGGAPGQADAAVIERINPQAGYVAGNLVMLSQRAAQARAGLNVLQTVRNAHRSQAAAEPVSGLDAAAWWRLAALRSFATPLPFHDALRLPLALLPPPRARVLNAVQGLQALLTLQFATPGWSARTRAIADWLPEHTLRHDYNLFIGALAPRVLEAAVGGVRQALEDAWLNERVQRRWQHFAASLGEAAAARLVERAADHAAAAPRSQRVGNTVSTAATAGSPPMNKATTTGASVSWLNARPGFNQVKVQFIMPKSNIASGLCN